ncbi:MAG: guanylate kinase [Ruthenibacterium sp.]
MNNARYLLVVSGPSGAGKDTVVSALREKHPEIAISVSATTRAMREGEQNGVNYHYMTRDAFEQKITAGEMLEYASYCGNYYGTPKSEVDARIEKATTVVLVIEVQGAANIKRLYPACTTVFICPPNSAELENRLRGRGTESEQSIAKRLRRAQEELALAPTYDYTVVNDDVDECANRIAAILKQRQQETIDSHGTK